MLKNVRAQSKDIARISLFPRKKTKKRGCPKQVANQESPIICKKSHFEPKRHTLLLKT